MLSLPCLENIIRFLWMDLSIALLGVVSNIYSRSKIVGSCMSFDKILCTMNFPANMYMLWFKFIFGLVFFIPVWFWFSFVSDYDNEYETMKNRNKSGLKNFKPKINSAVQFFSCIQYMVVNILITLNKLLYFQCIPLLI